MLYNCEFKHEIKAITYYYLTHSVMVEFDIVTARRTVSS